MNHELLLYAGISLLGVFISAISQVMLKKAAQREYPTKIQEYLNPLVITAYIIFFGTTLLSVVAYKVVPLSMGPILESTGYIYAMLFGVLFFHEKVDRRRLLGLALILVGIAVYALAG